MTLESFGTFKFKMVTNGDDFRNVRCLFYTVRWSVYCIFCLVAGYFMKDVIEQYQAKETYLGQSLKPITKIPTLVFCFDSEEKLKYGEDIRIVFENTLYEDNRKFLQIGPQYFPNVTIELTTISYNCFKINSTSSLSVLEPGAWRSFFVEVLSHDKLEVKVYFTSEENYFGVLFDDWLNPVYIQKLKPRQSISVSFQPSEFMYRTENSDCSKQSMIELWQGNLHRVNLSSCPERCTTNYVTGNISSLPICTNQSAFECAANQFYQNYAELKLKYRRPCYILEYAGSKLYDTFGGPNNTYAIAYKFASSEMTIEFKERLVFDTVNMIGSVGGTLGMCIGFSFSGIISTFLEFIQAKLIGSN